MIAKLGESISSKLGERVATLLSTGPAGYLAAAYVAWLITEGPAIGLKGTAAWIAGQTPTALIAFIVLGLLIVQGAGAVVTQCIVPATRLLEGYWPPPLGRAGRKWAWKRYQAAVDELRRLSPLVDDPAASATDLTGYAKADRLIHRMPSRAAWVLPTRLGNTLRAAETRPAEKYGLDPLKVWAALWLGLPEPVRTELDRARGRLDATVGGLLWCVIAVSLAAIAWWMAPVALTAAILAYRVWVLPAAADYSDLLEATFDTQRLVLYKALRLVPPVDTTADQPSGQQLTEYVWRGWPADPDERLSYQDTDQDAADQSHG